MYGMIVEEWEVGEETEVDGAEQCLCGWAEKCLMHIFDSVLQVRDCVFRGGDRVEESMLWEW